ncbi:beta-N-acetylhexosaminidase [Mucilaginibacter sp. L3T2-6]|uniref:beta-N-acetylhexosaminidase n=1 Tax=Mucilaginibacter sp. L3T2-6 TaxID=3062491 RepID=UPI002676BC80|nr:family 20 glycosylhydrolase [Mucilaginibacter sp. L3T2-6]MDO3644490.1 family 20 glycosylhydrolase [Mucilaginibacter sp. L3T2-6]MDV6216942.1 family 20 glycosylhydrolase [Mucilaginibacter sp. L3T2-6]
MKKLSLAFCCCFVSFLSFGQAVKSTLSIIPEPVKTVTKPGQFILPKNITIQAKLNKDVMPVTNYLRKKLTTATGAMVTIKGNSFAPATIKLLLTAKTDTTLGKEGYKLWVSGKGVVISANEPAGLFYGVQTLMQLLPKEIESAEVHHMRWTIPHVEITDYPRFAWRGLMLDVSRHFFTKEEVKQYIDQMVRYKFNLLHMHLTDDEGWRIEIKSLPRLTTVGAYNVKKVGEFGTFSKPTPDEPRTYGGFYTQDDIKELVKYGKEHFLNIMPEVDVPGHSLAAVVAYPELSCTPGAENYQVRSGEHMMDFSKEGIKALVDNTLNPASEKTYAFLDKVMGEIAQLFPFDYIHLGGDECAKNFWEQSADVKALMAKENLKNMEEVQSYFEKRLETIVESKGKKFMGWDEIIEGGLGPKAAVMSWRGIQGGITASRLGHEVVMSPTTFAYLDYMQSDRVMEPHVYATLRLNKSYQFEPVPDSADAKLILGGQANLWTEQVFNFRQVEYMTWPRGMAISESVWSPKAKKDWNNFYPKVEKQFARLNEAEIKYAPAMYDPDFKATMNGDKMNVELTTEIPNLDIYYSFDNSYPDRFYPKYMSALEVPEDATQLRVITYRGKEPVGRMITMPIAELKRRIGRSGQ